MATLIDVNTSDMSLSELVSLALAGSVRQAANCSGANGNDASDKRRWCLVSI